MSHDSPRSGEARSLFSLWFVAAAVILLAATLGMRPAIDGLIDHFSKDPIGLRRPLARLDTLQFDAFRYMPDRDEVARAFAYDDIGTDEWIAYVFTEADDAKREYILFVTYYSDPRDSIPHTPEVCYRQAGGVVQGDRRRPLPIPDHPELTGLTARELDIRQTGDRIAVVYVIVCNRKVFTGRESARLEIGRPGDKRTFFSKVEVVSIVPPGVPFEEAADRATALLAETLPILYDDHFATRADLARPAEEDP